MDDNENSAIRPNFACSIMATKGTRSRNIMINKDVKSELHQNKKTKLPNLYN